MILDTDQQTASVSGGRYVFSSDFGTGSASIHYKLDNGTKWYSIGTLVDGEGVPVTLPTNCIIRLTKTNDATVEVDKV